ncbi:MAG: thioredoxin family protein [Pyrinomonadaceae bacterium]
MKEYIERSMSYDEYRGLLDRLISEGKTTGASQSETRTAFTRLNRARMDRIEKTIQLAESTAAAARNARRSMIWLIITEGWCGDAAQNVPVIEKIAAENDKIETRYILRDEHPELIDRFLTAGSRSIPKLIALDADSHEVLGTWGSRPQAAEDLFLEKTAGGLEKSVIMEELQRWYNLDKGRSIGSEFEARLLDWNSKIAAMAA